MELIKENKERSMPSIDRLSCLPDEIICHILAFLPTKRSVRTSVLSKRWRFLWAHLPSLEFNCSVNLEIISKILLQHKRDIHTLHLYGYFKGTEKEFESLIVNIPNIVMNLSHRLPQCLFSCKTMVDLRLLCDGYIPESGIYLPVLKKLRLHCFHYHSHEESFAHLISGCPVLEEFIFNGKVWGHFSVSSSILTRLVLSLQNEDILKFGLELDTPALRYLRLECYVPDKFSVGALDSLVEADISLYWDKRHQDNLLYSRNVLALVGKLHNVRLLSLHIGWIHSSAFFASGIKFHNLTKLYLSANLGFITSFLENANNLQVLRLVIHRTDNIDNQYYWMEPKRVPACMLLHLQTVNIRSFGYSEEEFDIIRYILMNAKVLKRVEIHSYLKKKFVAIERLASFGRGSQECELLFNGDCLEIGFGGKA